MSGLFDRNVPGLTSRLQTACVGIAGCGGLGSNAAAALTRAGIGHLILADFDSVELSNLNRQMFFQQDVGQLKVVALSNHLKAINPNVNISTHQTRVTPQTIHDIFSSADILIEAFDLAEAKTWLIRSWSNLFPDRPIISGNGLSGYGKSQDISIVQAGNIYFCGDLKTDMSMGLCSSRVAIVANLQANVAIELLMDGRIHDSGE